MYLLISSATKAAASIDRTFSSIRLNAFMDVLPELACETARRVVHFFGRHGSARPRGHLIF